MLLNAELQGGIAASVKIPVATRDSKNLKIRTQITCFQNYPGVRATQLHVQVHKMEQKNYSSVF